MRLDERVRVRSYSFITPIAEPIVVGEDDEIMYELIASSISDA